MGRAGGGCGPLTAVVSGTRRATQRGDRSLERLTHREAAAVSPEIILKEK